MRPRAGDSFAIVLADRLAEGHPEPVIHGQRPVTGAITFGKSIHSPDSFRCRHANRHADDRSFADADPAADSAADPRRRAPTPSPTRRPAAVIVTFRVVDEEYRMLLTDRADIDIALLLLEGQPAPSIPNGRVVRGGPVSTRVEWSIDPDSLEFADVTIEVCDGLPSHVEEGILTGDRYCPWSAEVIALEPFDPGN